MNSDLKNQHIKNATKLFPFKKVKSKNKKLFLFHSLSTLIKGFLAGVMVALGGAVYLSTNSKYLGAALFSVGLFVIFSYGFALYTGKIGYAVVQNRRQNLQLIPTWLGNFIGAASVGYILRLTRAYLKLANRAVEQTSQTISDSIFSIFILAFFCGLLMFIAADNYKNAANTVQKYLSIILPVMVFILCGFEHCVANMFYFSISNNWTFKALGYLVVMTAGNSLGGMFIPLFHKLIGLLRLKIKQH